MSASQSNLIKRKRGTCRFEPYYRVQVFDVRFQTWSDIKGSYTTLDGAISRATGITKPFRIRLISEEGSKIL